MTALIELLDLLNRGLLDPANYQAIDQNPDIHANMDQSRRGPSWASQGPLMQQARLSSDMNVRRRVTRVTGSCRSITPVSIRGRIEGGRTVRQPSDRHV